MPSCWLAKHSEKPCAGFLDPAHLITKQTLKRKKISAVWDRRWWVPACRYHHGQFDNYRLTVPRSAIPKETEILAEAHGLTWALDRRFGPHA